MAEPFKSMSRTSLFYRYSFVRLMYTCLFEVSLSGGTCFDPLFYHYPNDEELYKDYEHTFMFANYIKVSPILEPLPDNSSEYKAYFPKGKWVSIYNLGNIIDCSSEGRWVNLQLLPVIQSHLREGSIIPYQDNLHYRAKNTVELLKLPITLIAHRNKHGVA